MNQHGVDPGTASPTPIQTRSRRFFSFLSQTIRIVYRGVHLNFCVGSHLAMQNSPVVGMLDQQMRAIFYLLKIIMSVNE